MAWHTHPADQVGRKDESPLQNADQEGFPPIVIVGNLPGEFLDPFVDHLSSGNKISGFISANPSTSGRMQSYQP